MASPPGNCRILLGMPHGRCRVPGGHRCHRQKRSATGTRSPGFLLRNAVGCPERISDFGLGFMSSPPAHKRLILIATLVLVDAGIICWPIPWISESSLMVPLVTYSFLALMVVDLWSTRKLHRATLWGGAFLVVFGRRRE